MLRPLPPRTAAIAAAVPLLLAAFALQPSAQQPTEFKIPEDEIARQRDTASGQMLLTEALQFIQVPQARKTFGVTGDGLVAAILDTGIRPTHVDFHGRVVAQVNFTSDYNGDRTNAADGQGHGTNVSGIVAARRDPKRPTDPTGEHEGVAPDAGLAALKVLTNTGNGSFQAVEDALQWVLDNARDPSQPVTSDDDRRKFPITVVNLSLSDQQNHKTPAAFETSRMRARIQALVARRIAVVVAAGNEYFTQRSEQGMGYPAIIPETLSVGAFYDANVGRQAYRSGAIAEQTKPSQITAFSQRLHSTLAATARTDVFAPGAVITSTGRTTDRGESDQQGTSQAAPVTAGVILLMQQYHLKHAKRLPEVTDLERWLRAGAIDERDNYGDRDNVTNTDLAFPRLAAVGALTAMKKELKVP